MQNESPAQQSEERREVCKWCGHELVTPFGGKQLVSKITSSAFCNRPGGGYHEPALPSIPTETREPEIPSDLRKHHSFLKETDRGVGLSMSERRQLEYIERIARSETREKVLEDALRWALGETGDFPVRSGDDGMFWWRTELRKRAGLEATNGER